LADPPESDTTSIVLILARFRLLRTRKNSERAARRTQARLDQRREARRIVLRANNHVRFSFIFLRAGIIFNRPQSIPERVMRVALYQSVDRPKFWNGVLAAFKISQPTVLGHLKIGINRGRTT
jgi:hypothetical protein